MMKHIFSIVLTVTLFSNFVYAFEPTKPSCKLEFFAKNHGSDTWETLEYATDKMIYQSKNVEVNVQDKDSCIIRAMNHFTNTLDHNGWHLPTGAAWSSPNNLLERPQIKVKYIYRDGGGSSNGEISLVISGE